MRVLLICLAALSFLGVNVAQASESRCMVTVSPTYGTAIEVDDSHYHLLEGDTPVEAGWLLPVAFEEGTVQANTENGTLWLWEEKDGRIFIAPSLKVDKDTEATGILFDQRGLYKATIKNGEKERKVDFAVGPTGVNFSPACSDPEVLTKELEEITKLIQRAQKELPSQEELVVDVEKTEPARKTTKTAAPVAKPALPAEAASSPSQVHKPTASAPATAPAPAPGNAPVPGPASAGVSAPAAGPAPAPAAAPAPVVDPPPAPSASPGEQAAPGASASNPSTPQASMQQAETASGQRLMFVSGALSGIGVLAFAVGLMMFLNTWRRKKLAEQPLE